MLRRLPDRPQVNLGRAGASPGLLVQALGIALLASSSGVSTKISMNSPAPNRPRAISRSARKGEMKAADDQPGIGHQLGDLGDAADVLDAIGLGEPRSLFSP